MKELLVCFIHYQMGSIQQAWQLIDAYLTDQTQRLTDIVNTVCDVAQATALLKYYQNEQNHHTLAKLYQQHNSHILTVFDEHYPTHLLEMYQPPPVLFCKGNLQLLNRLETICFVGNEQISYYGEQLLQTLVPDIKSAVFIGQFTHQVSVQTFEHALQNKQPIVAILTSGFEDYKPLRTMFMRKKIEAIGLVLTEYPLTMRHHVTHLKRTREIMVTLAKVVCVIEASINDYSLLSAYSAIEHNKDVLVPPANVFTQTSFGTNQLLKEGAGLLLDIQDIHDVLYDKRLHIKNDKTMV